LNCGSYLENLLNELFGHEGAYRCRFVRPAFDQADSNSLLDEIGEMPLPSGETAARPAEGRFAPGSSINKKVDVRENWHFRLAAGFYRGSGPVLRITSSISVPPLRERTEDIRFRIHFRIQPATVRLSRFHRNLMGYAWPGNVRELENCVERALVLCEGNLLRSECLPESMLRERRSSGGSDSTPDCFSLKRASETLEKEFIRKALEKTGGNRTHAAKILEISHRALLYKIKEYKMD
jgi:two-component system response regulator AtoC